MMKPKLIAVLVQQVCWQIGYEWRVANNQQPVAHG